MINKYQNYIKPACPKKKLIQNPENLFPTYIKKMCCVCNFIGRRIVKLIEYLDTEKMVSLDKRKQMTNLEFSNIIEGIKDKMYRLALRIVGNEFDAEDVVQEVIIKVWNKRDHFATIDNQAGWCMTLTRNKAIDKTRSKHRRTNDLADYSNLSTGSPNPESTLVTNDLLARVKELYNQLPEIQKTVLHLRDIEEYSYDEIAEITGFTNNQVKINIYRGRQALKEQLEVLKNA